MDTKVKILLDSNNNYKTYLRYNSYWYKILGREPNKIDDFIKEYKERNKLRVTDKIESAVDKLSLISKFMEVLRW